jgi:hypothetical protein
VNREASRVAHRLARRGLLRQDGAVMRFQAPVEVRELIQTEAACEGSQAPQCNPLFS